MAEDISHLDDTEHRARIADDLLNRQIYFRQDTYVELPSPYERRTSAVRRHRNIIRAVVDTAGAVTTRQTPVAEVGTYGGSADQARAARDLTRFGQGVFQANNWPRVAKTAWLDARLCAFGAVLWEVLPPAAGRRTRRVVCSRLDPCHVFPNGNKPDKITIRRFLNPTEIQERGWEAKLGITDADYREAPHYANERQSAEVAKELRVVEVVQTWDLSAAPAQVRVSLGARSGRNVRGDRSFQEEYKATRFPMAFCVWSETPGSFLGVSVAAIGRKYDLQINQLSRVEIDVATRGMAPKILSPVGSEPLDRPWTSATFERIYYRGPAPTWMPGATLPPQFFEIYDRCKREYQEEVGVSESSVEATRPAGVNSLPGQREFQENITGRLAPALERWEELTRDSFEAMLSECFRVLGKDSAKIASPGRRFIEEIDWAGARAAWDEITVRINKTSALPIHPASRREFVRELRADGAIKDQATYLQLLGIPDLEQFDDVETADVDLQDKQIDEALFEAKISTPPDESQDLERFDRHCTLRLLRAIGSGGHSADQIAALVTLREQVRAKKRLLAPVAAPDAEANAELQPPDPGEAPPPPGS